LNTYLKHGIFHGGRNAPVEKLATTVNISVRWLSKGIFVICILFVVQI